MPAEQDVQIDKALTNLVVAIRPTGFRMGEVFPVVKVKHRTGKYFTWGQGEWFRDEAEEIAPGGEAPRGEFAPSSSTYSVKTTKFAIALPDETRDNSDSQLQLPATCALFARDKVEIKKEIRVTTLLTTTGNWGGNASPVNKWDAEGSTPIDDMEAGIDAVVEGTGYLPNTIAAGYKVMKALKLHTTIIDRIKYTSATPPTPALMANLLGVERFIVVTAIKNTSKRGQTAAYSFIFSDYVWIGYVAPRPAINIASAGYQFQRGGTRIRTFREESREQTVYEASEAVTEAVTSSLLGYVLTDVLT